MAYVEAHDKLGFNIPKVKDGVDSFRTENHKNQQIKEDFLSYVGTELRREWNTDNGQEAVGEIEKFVNTKYQDYINYLDRRINALEYDVIPALDRINKA